MDGSTVLAGGAGLDRRVSGVNIIEVPDVHRWLKGGEFLFTSGFPWRDDPGRFAEVVAELEAIGAAGIGVKLGAYVSRVPDEVLASAEACGLPIISVPPDVPYMEVIEPLYQRITARRLWALERSAEAKGIFATLGLDHQSIERVAAALADEVRNTVYVTDLVDEAVTVAAPGEPPIRTSFASLGEPTASLVAEAVRLDLRRTPTSVILAAGRGIGASLVVERRVEGQILVIEDGKPFTEFVELALAHAAELVSFLVLTRLSRLAGRMEAAQLFLDSLMSDRLTSEEAAERAVTLGLRLTRPCVALVVGWSTRGRSSAPPPIRAIERALSGLPHVVGTLETGEHLVLVQAAAEPDGGSDPTSDAVSRIEDRLASAPGEAALIGSGTALVGVEGVRRSRSEALIAYRAARQRGLSGGVGFSDLGVERVLSQIPMNEITEDYITTTIGPLLEDPELFRTLQTYLECGGSKVATAAAIPLHRSSLMYRLRKIETVLGADLDDPVQQLELWLAVRLHQIVLLTSPRER
jgi:purine catabolism regulator